MRVPAAAALVLGCVAACGGDGTGVTVDVVISPPDVAHAPPDAAPIDAQPCAPLPIPSWIEDYERDVVSRLAGAAEITPGVTLTQRASATNRMITREWIFDELARLGHTPERHQYDANGANVLARLPATRPGGATIVLGAHFDGVPAGPAAADDGTGTALVLTAARHFVDKPCRAHDVVFVLFDQEESGLIGSTFFADRLASEGDTVRAVHVFDMISWDSDGDRAIELWNPDPDLLADWMAAAAGTHPVRPVAFDFSDHYPFGQLGFPTVGVSEEVVSGDANPHYHTATDTAANVSFPYLADVTRVALTVVDGELQ